MNRLKSRAPVVGGWAIALAALASACTPDVGSSGPAPTSMQFDLTATPPRVPQPTALVVNPQTGLIDFGLAGTPLPADCSTQTALTPAQCQFDQWLQTLNGFPSLSPSSAPASAALDPATLTLGTNVVVVGLPGNTPLTTGLDVGFDEASSSVTVTPPGPWALGEFYWMGVRGYASGIRDAAGGEVVGSPTMALLKQDTSLTCDATDPTQIDPHCPGYEVVAQGDPMPTPAEAAMQLFQLEAIRQAYVGGGGFAAMDASGLPKNEIAVLWGFPIHTNSVPLLLPGTAAVPHVPAANQIVVGVQGPVDPATVSAFTVRVANWPVVVMDLTAAAAGDLNAGFPPVAATYLASVGAIAIQSSAPFPAGHTLGLFFTNAIHSPDGAPLVASPVSVLLTLTAPLVDGAGHSTVSGVADADAAALEAGRQALQPLLDNPIFSPLTGVTRANLVYCYAFVPTVMP
jgi:hypothetical protein